MQNSNSKDNRIRALCEGAIMVTLAIALGFIRIIQLPQGGSVSLEMFPIFIYCIKWGAKQGFKCSLAYGVLYLLIDGAYAWGPTSMILDYIAAFGILGVCGFFSKKENGIYLGITVGSIARFIIHFISGVTIYRIYAPTEVFNITIVNPYIYSAVYNGSFMLIDYIFCMLLAGLLHKRLRAFFAGNGGNI